MTCFAHRPCQTLFKNKQMSRQGAKRQKYQQENLESMPCASLWQTFLNIILQREWRKKEERSALSVPPSSQVQAVGEGIQLLLSQPMFLLQVLLPYEQRGLGLDEAPVVLQLLGRQLTGQEGGDHVLSPVQVILQVFGVLPLLAQQTMAAVQRLLRAETV